MVGLVEGCVQEGMRTKGKFVQKAKIKGKIVECVQCVWFKARIEIERVYVVQGEIEDGYYYDLNFKKIK